MRLVSYDDGDGTLRGGALAPDGVIDLGAALGAPGAVSVREALALDPAVLRAAIAGARPARPLTGTRLGPPVPDPDKIVCLGLNYRDHAAEIGMDVPHTPMLFAKFRNSLVGPEDPIVLPRGTHDVDYEAELAIVVGARAKDVAPGDALAHVAGLTCFNDVSARDLQMATSQWLGGKAIDTFGPCGPAVVTLEELGDPQDLGIRTRVNGRTVQDSSTAQMVFGVAQALAFVSTVMTLEPGDLIATGTPAGVGFTRSPQVLLAAGDVVEVEIDGLGALRNPVVAPAD